MSAPHSVRKYDGGLSPRLTSPSAGVLHDESASVTVQPTPLVYSPAKSAIIQAARDTGGLFATQLFDMLEKRQALDEAIASRDDERARLAAEALAHASAALDGACLDLYDTLTRAAGFAAAREYSMEVIA